MHHPWMRKKKHSRKMCKKHIRTMMAADTMPMMSDAGGVKSASFPTAMETAEETTVSDAGGNKSIEGQTTTMICVFVGDDKGGGEERGSNEEGDAVLAEEGWKEGSWAPSLSAFTALDSFMVRGRMLGGSNKGGDKEGNEVVDVARTLDNDSREEGDSNDNHHAQEQPCQRASSRVPFRTIVPQAKPLSLGEVLGSTLPWGGDEEGDDVGTNLGWGEEETTLTDGAMDPGGDVGADDGSTEDKDEIGLISDEGAGEEHESIEGLTMTTIGDGGGDDGFQKWHQDMKFRISTTIVVNVGIATVSPSQVSEVNKLLSPICDGSMRKRKQTDQFGQPRGDMTNADDTTKKLKPAATVARSESSLKDLGTLKCYVCGADVWPKHGLWIGSHCVEEMDHVCDYCKKLVKRQKQDRLEKWESVKDKIFDCDSSGDEEEDAEESLVPMETKLIPSLLGNVYLNPYLLGNVVLAIGVMARIGNRGRATIAGIDLGSTNSAEKDRIDGNPQRTMYQSKRIIRRKIDPTLVAEGRESFHAHEYWRPNRLVSFKTVATPVLFMGRRERKKAPNKTQTNIAKEKLLWQCIHSRCEAMKLMRPLTAKEQSVVFGATTKGIGSRSEILASQDGDSIQRGSMQTLRPGIWLNGEVAT